MAAAMEQVPCVKLFSRIHTPPKEKLIHAIESVIGKGGVVDLDVEFCYHFELSDPLENTQVCETWEGNIKKGG